MALGLVGIHINPGSSALAAAPAAAIDANGDAKLLGLLTSDPTSPRATAGPGAQWSLPALCGGLERLARAGVARDIGGWWERT